MVESDRVTFEAIMQGLAENFNVTLTKNGIALRYEALKSLDVQEIARAALAIVTSRKYTTMPTVADFLEFLGGGSAEDRAELEASKVWDVISGVGGYRSVVFDDAVTMAVVEYGFGGWSKLCGDTLVDQRKWFIKDFVRVYGAYSRQRIQLTGRLEGRGGGPGDLPRLIGNPEKALLIMNTTPLNRPSQITDTSTMTDGIRMIAERFAENDD